MRNYAPVGAWLVAALVLGAIARDMLGGPASPQP
jgi:hypothetical protein